MHFLFLGKIIAILIAGCFFFGMDVMILSAATSKKASNDNSLEIRILELLASQGNKDAYQGLRAKWDEERQAGLKFLADREKERYLQYIRDLVLEYEANKKANYIKILHERDADNHKKASDEQKNKIMIEHEKNKKNSFDLIRLSGLLALGRQDPDDGSGDCLAKAKDDFKISQSCSNSISADFYRCQGITNARLLSCIAGFKKCIKGLPNRCSVSDMVTCLKAGCGFS